MKKILAITVAFMYLAITSGLVLQIHYCMDRQIGSSIQFAELHSKKCTTCGMQNAKNKCCHDEVKFIKLQDVHQQVTASYSFAPLPAIQQDFELKNIYFTDVPDNSTACSNAPPGSEEDIRLPLFILHGVFRI